MINPQELNPVPHLVVQLECALRYILPDTRQKISAATYQKFIQLCWYSESNILTYAGKYYLFNGPTRHNPYYTIVEVQECALYQESVEKAVRSISKSGCHAYFESDMPVSKSGEQVFQVMASNRKSVIVEVKQVRPENKRAYFKWNIIK